MIKDRGLWVYDIETLASCFTYTAFNVDTQEIVQFVLHNDRWDYNSLIMHLKTCKGHIGFNNVNFDYPVIHFILTSTNDTLSREFLIREIHNKATSIIEEQNQKNFVTSVSIKESETLIPQLDLFKIWHYNNKARSTSLKALEISMNYPNVMEMPIDHKRTDISFDEIPPILEYNLNDVLATYRFYTNSLLKIELRKSLITQFSIPCINWSDSRIGEQLILKLYTDKTKTNPWDVKKMRTHRSSINLGECILPYINFKSNDFTKLLNKLKGKVIKETKGSIAESVIYKGFKYDYGTGGIHGCIKPGVYESNEDYVIIDADVNSGILTF